jgi:O-antigen/teichoic acid export membrane protein
LVAESALKLIFAVFLVAVGYGVMGAIGALSGSVIGAYLVTRTKHVLHPEQGGEYERASFREGIQAIVFFVGQVVINNIDILMVKHYFVAADAGVYAAVALVGRVLYFACWMVVSAMFPVSAAREHEGGAWQVLRWPILIVSVMSVGAVAIMALFPRIIMHLVFGDNFYQSEHLLAIYAALTGIYALVVTLITFEMSRKIANTGWLQLAFSLLVIVGIAFFHATLMQVAMVQLVLMVALLAAVSIPFLLKHQKAELEAAA